MPFYYLKITYKNINVLFKNLLALFSKNCWLYSIENEIIYIENNGNSHRSLTAASAANSVVSGAGIVSIAAGTNAVVKVTAKDATGMI